MYNILISHGLGSMTDGILSINTTNKNTTYNYNLYTYNIPIKEIETLRIDIPKIVTSLQLNLRCEFNPTGNAGPTGPTGGANNLNEYHECCPCKTKGSHNV